LLECTGSTALSDDLGGLVERNLNASLTACPDDTEDYVLPIVVTPLEQSGTRLAWLARPAILVDLWDLGWAPVVAIALGVVAVICRGITHKDISILNLDCGDWRSLSWNKSALISVLEVRIVDVGVLDLRATVSLDRAVMLVEGV
jgi:hypothetical protein